MVGTYGAPGKQIISEEANCINWLITLINMLVISVNDPN